MGKYQVVPRVKRSKYGNRKATAYGQVFDSTLERDRFLFLKASEQAGKIHSLVTQYRVPLVAHGQHICDLILDFAYVLGSTGRLIREDAKGIITDVARLKLKLYAAQTGHAVHIVTKATLTKLPEG